MKRSTTVSVAFCACLAFVTACNPTLLVGGTGASASSTNTTSGNGGATYGSAAYGSTTGPGGAPATGTTGPGGAPTTGPGGASSLSGTGGAIWLSGTGGATATTTTTGAGGATMTSGTGGSTSTGGCTDPYVEVQASGQVYVFTGSCAGWEVGGNANAAVGYVSAATSQPGVGNLWAIGCSSPGGDPDVGSFFIKSASNGLGTSGGVFSLTIPGSGVTLNANPAPGTVQVTDISADTISGSFSGVLEPLSDAPSIAVQGTFHVCRGPDAPAL